MKFDLKKLEEVLDTIFNITFKLFGILCSLIGSIVLIYILIK